METLELIEYSGEMKIMGQYIKKQKPSQTQIKTEATLVFQADSMYDLLF